MERDICKSLDGLNKTIHRSFKNLNESINACFLELKKLNNRLNVEESGGDDQNGEEK